MKKILIILLLIILSCLCFAEQNVTCGAVLVNSGVYTLNATGTSVNDCIDIFGSDIELDCRGNIIFYGTNGGNTEFGIDIYNTTVPQTNVTVRNCNITRLGSGTNGYAIRVINTSNVLIENNILNTNSSTTNGYGAYFQFSDNNTINNNTINTCWDKKACTTGNVGIVFADGVCFSKISNNRINTFGTTTGYGVYFNSVLNWSTSYNNITNNVILTNGSSTGNDGVYFTGNITYNIVSGNLINASGTSTLKGFSALGVTGDRWVENNTIIDNVFYVSNNTKIASSNAGIVINSNVRGNNITRNNMTIIGTTVNLGYQTSGATALQNDRNYFTNNIVLVYGNSTSATQYGAYVLTNVSNNVIKDNYFYLTGGTTEYVIFVSCALANYCPYNVFDNNTMILNGTTLTNYGFYGTTSLYYNNITNNNITVICGTTGCQAIRLLGVAGGTLMDGNIVTGNYGWVNGSTTSLGMIATTGIFNHYIAYNNFYSMSVTTPTVFSLVGATDGGVETNIVEYNNFTATASIGATSAYCGLTSSNTNENIIRYNNCNVRGGSANQGWQFLSTSAFDNTKNIFYGNRIYMNDTNIGLNSYGIYLITNVVENYFYDNNITMYTNQSSYAFFLSSGTYPVIDNKIYNNDVTMMGNFTTSKILYGFYALTGSNGNNISNNRFNIYARDNARGIFVSVSARNLIYDNVFFVNSTLNTSAGVVVSGNSVSTEIVNNNFTWVQGHAVQLIYSGYAPDYAIVKENNIINRHKRFDLFDLYIQNTATKSVTGTELINQKIESYNFTGKGVLSLTIENTTTGKIVFNTVVTGNGTNLSDEILLFPNNFTIDGNVKVMFNKSATLTLYNVPAFSSPVTYRNGVLCVATYCGNLTYLGNSAYTFVANSWSSYSIGQDTNLFKYLCDWISAIYVKPFYTYNEKMCYKFNKTVDLLLNDEIFMTNIYTENITTCDIELTNETVLATNGTMCWRIYNNKEIQHSAITLNLNSTNLTIIENNKTITGKLEKITINN